MSVNKVNLYAITDEASRWRDVDDKYKALEIVSKVAAVAGILIVLAGIAVGCYYAATTSETITRVSGEVFKSTNAPLCILSLLGIMPIVGLSTGFYHSNFEWNFNKDQQKYTETLHDDLVDLVTKKEIGDIYNRYYRQNGGLNILVQNGL